VRNIGDIWFPLSISAYRREELGLNSSVGRKTFRLRLAVRGPLVAIRQTEGGADDRTFGTALGNNGP